MLKFNLPHYWTWYSFKYLNTSYVKVQHIHSIFKALHVLYLNTSYVKVQLIMLMVIIIMLFHLNTSYVKVQLLSHCYSS